MSDVSFNGGTMPPKVRGDVTVQQVGDESLVLDLASGQIHQLNATAAWILLQCDGENTTESIVRGFADYFEVDAATAASDVTGALERLSQAGVLEGD
jgi:hypothetical protein